MKAATLLLTAFGCMGCDAGAAERTAAPSRASPDAGLERTSRADAERALEERLDGLREGLDELRADARRSADRALADADAALRREIEEAEALLDELRRSGDDAWAELRDDAAREIRRLGERLADSVDTR